MAAKKATERKTGEIEWLIATWFNFRKNIIVPNVSFGLFPRHEADMLILNRSGYLTEVEIKRSWSDFLNDFKKTTTHDEGKVSLKYFAVPISIKDKVLGHLENVDPGKIWGVLCYNEDLKFEYIREPSNYYIRDPKNKLTVEEQLKLARLGAMRVWNLKKKLYNITDNCTRL